MLNEKRRNGQVVLAIAALCTGLAVMACGGAGDGGDGDLPEGPAIYATIDDGLGSACSRLPIVQEAACGERIFICGVGLTPDEVLVIEREANGERSEVMPVQTTREDHPTTDPGFFSHVGDDILPEDCSPGESYRFLVTDPQAGELSTTITAI